MGWSTTDAVYPVEFVVLGDRRLGLQVTTTVEAADVKRRPEGVERGQAVMIWETASFPLDWHRRSPERQAKWLNEANRTLQARVDRSVRACRDEMAPEEMAVYNEIRERDGEPPL